MSFRSTPGASRASCSSAASSDPAANILQGDPGTPLTHDATGNHASIPLFGVQSVSVFTGACANRAATITNPTPGVIRITITGVTAGQQFIANIKIDPGTVVGAAAPNPTTVNFNYATVIGGTTVTDADGQLKKKGT